MVNLGQALMHELAKLKAAKFTGTMAFWLITEEQRVAAVDLGSGTKTIWETTVALVSEAAHVFEMEWQI